MASSTDRHRLPDQHRWRAWRAVPALLAGYRNPMPNVPPGLNGMDNGMDKWNGMDMEMDRNQTKN